MELQGSHVLVTGASRGIGEAIAREVSARGAMVTLIARNAAALEALAADLGGTALPADLATPTGRDGLVDRVLAAAGRPVDVLVNNAGIEVSGPFTSTTVDEIRTIHEINLLAPIELTHQVVPSMLERGRGHIVNVSSMASSGGFAGMSVYCATKAGLSHFTRILRTELKGRGLTFTIAELGPIPTDMLAHVDEYPPAAQSFDRLERWKLMPQIPREVVARQVADAIEKERLYVWLPKRAAAFPFFNALPQRILDPMLRGIDPAGVRTRGSSGG